MEEEDFGGKVIGEKIEIIKEENKKKKEVD